MSLSDNDLTTLNFNDVYKDAKWAATASTDDAAKKKTTKTDDTTKKTENGGTPPSFNEDTSGMYYDREGETNILGTISVFLFFYFLLYFLISIFFSFETLTFIFNSIDFLFVIYIFAYAVFFVFSNIELNALNLIKQIWANLNRMIISPYYIFYILLFIVIFQLCLYFFSFQLSIYKPIILSVIEALLYILFFVILIIDILQYAFNIPLTTIIENDIDRQYTLFANSGKKDPVIVVQQQSPPVAKEEGCININKFKDPESIHSFYEEQMNSYRLLKNQFENIVPAVKTNEFVPPVYDFKGGDFKYNYYLTQNDSLGFDFKDIKSMLKYWTDNSGNIVSSNEFEKM